MTFAQCEGCGRTAGTVRMCAECIAMASVEARSFEFASFVQHLKLVAPAGTDFSKCDVLGIADRKAAYPLYLVTFAAAVEKDVLGHPERYKNRKVGK